MLRLWQNLVATMRAVAGQFIALIGGYLLVLTAVMTVLAIFLLSAVLVQSRVAQLQVNGQSLTIWRVVELRRGVERWQAELDYKTRNLAELRELLSKNKSTDDAAAAALDLSRAAFARDVRLAAQLLDAESAGPGQSKVTVPETEDGRADELLAASVDLQQQFERLPAPSGVLKARVERLRINHERLETDAERAAAAQQAYEQLKGVEQSATAAHKEAKAQFSRLFLTEGSELPAETTGRIMNLITETAWITGPSEAESIPVFGAAIRISRQIALLPSDQLTLFLVIAMGVLGSTLYLLSAFLKGDSSVNRAGYMIRPWLGAVTALAVFVIANAGAPIISDASRLGAGAGVNPYFVSFLAIVSGLMTERALASVQGAARGLLGSGEAAGAIDRYAVSDAFTELKGDQERIAALARLLDHPADEMAELLSGHKPVPQREQELIAAFVGRPIRRLFSDLEE